MVRFWRWFKSRGQPAGKPVGADKTMGESASVRKSDWKAVAVEQAADNWDEDGDRADQDYYPVPGGGSPDVKDPPALDGEPLAKSGKAPSAKTPSAKIPSAKTPSAKTTSAKATGTKSTRGKRPRAEPGSA